MNNSIITAPAPISMQAEEFGYNRFIKVDM